MKRPDQITRWRIAAFLLGVTGFVLLWIFAGKYVALGAFLMIWGNNLSLAAEKLARSAYRNRLAEVQTAFVNEIRNGRAGPARPLATASGSAAPSGDARITGGTNTEAEVTGKESP